MSTLAIKIPSAKRDQIQKALQALEKKAGIQLFKHYPQVDLNGKSTGLRDIPMCPAEYDSVSMQPTGWACAYLELEIEGDPSAADDAALMELLREGV